MRSFLFNFFAALALVSSLLSPAHAIRIKEIAAVQGVRSNQLTGYGLVVGLDGTGDQTTQMPYTTQSVANYLQQLGITLPDNRASQLQLKNVAAVIVTAQLPAFAQPRPDPGHQRFVDGQCALAQGRNAGGDTIARARTARSTRWHRATWWSAAPARRPAGARCRSTT